MTEERRIGGVDETLRWSPGDMLAVLYTFGYLAMVGAVIYFPIPEDNSQMLNTLVTIMSTIQIGIGKCYYDRNKADIAAQKVAAVELAKSSTTMREIASTAAPVQAAAVAAARAPAPADPIIPKAAPPAQNGDVTTGTTTITTGDKTA